MSQEYSRNLCVAGSLATRDWKLYECRVHNSVDMQTRLKTFKDPFVFTASCFRSLREWTQLAYRHVQTPLYDVLLVGYPSHADIFLGAFLARLRGRPVVMDAFVGLYDTVVNDRNLVSARNPLSRLIRLWEHTALHMADLVLVDTPENALALSKEYHLPYDRVLPVPVGIDEEVWKPRPLPAHTSPFRVGFWSTFIALHGVETVVRAAKMLEEAGEPIQIEVIGDGQMAERFASLQEELRPVNIRWHRGFFSMNRVLDLAKKSHCCLGIMGSTSKAARVVPYKAYQALAMGRPLITADTPAMRRILKHKESALLVPPGSAKSLAEAITYLAHDREFCERLAFEGRRVYERHLSNRVMGDILNRAFHQVIYTHRERDGAGKAK
jgi:glycosyltransferase involved in cell wall biosynthesis